MPESPDDRDDEFDDEFDEDDEDEDDVGPRRLRRSWAQRSVLAVNVLVILACFVTAGAVYYGSEKANDRRTFRADALTIQTTPTSPPSVAATTPPSTVPGQTVAPATSSTSTTIPAVDVDAANYLITGSDNNACVDPDSPYASAFGDRTNYGERSDTIMLIRLDPATNQGAVLSFPRDLWVKIAGRNSKSRINSAFDLSDPNRLVQTIWDNFQIKVDHAINIDFCAFKNIVDAVGGVSVPFETPVKDSHTGLDITSTGCVNLNGEAGLAYVRSRHLRYLDPKTGEYKEDKSADFGRISRQQDFLRRALQKAVQKGVRDPLVAKQLIDAGIKYVTLDPSLTVGKLLDLAIAMRNLDPTTIHTYQIENRGERISGQSVLVPVESDNMNAILSVFRGEARLADAPEQVWEQATGTTLPGSATTLPLVLAENDVFGVVPPADVSC